MKKIVFLIVVLGLCLSVMQPVSAQMAIPPEDFLRKLLNMLSGKNFGVSAYCIDEEQTLSGLGDVFLVIVRVKYNDAALIQLLNDLDFKFINQMGTEYEYWKQFNSKPDDPSPCPPTGTVETIFAAAGLMKDNMGHYRPPNPPAVPHGRPARPFILPAGVGLLIILILAYIKRNQQRPRFV